MHLLRRSHRRGDWQDLGREQAALKPVSIRRDRVYARHRYEGLSERKLTRWYVAGGGVLCAGLAWLALVSPAFSISSVTISGYSRLHPALLEGAVAEQLSGRWLGLAPRANYFLLNERGVAQALTAIPAVRSVRVSRRFPKTLEVAVEERTANIVWVTGGQPYELDLDGRVLRRLEPAQLPDLPTVHDSSGAAVELGQVVMAASAASSAVAIAENLGGLTVARFTVAGPNPMDLRAEVTEGWSVRLSAAVDLGEQRAALSAVLGQLGNVERRRLDYVDVRTPRLPTYRLKP